ncbi:nuclear protein 1 [Plakobranchus ocellatus]|uniref:Nuclear protein 1 n=1 Tax=Plakobranchus ocellatus TaxID=259542 RepID=A0AAV4CAJ2_9GAST|nr:nuclear protein 1 [Plakobranchus ocellatus]
MYHKPIFWFLPYGWNLAIAIVTTINLSYEIVAYLELLPYEKLNLHLVLLIPINCHVIITDCSLRQFVTILANKMPVSTYFIDHNLDQYDHMSMDIHKHVNSPHSGKGRSKREARANTNRPDLGGHCRKTVQKLLNNSHKKRL